MRIEQLIYLADIAQTGSISTTAQRVFLSQQAVSESIRSLERELGCKLLNRSKTGVTLTPKGQITAEHAAAMITQYHAMLSALSNEEDTTEFTGQILVTSSPMVTASIMPGVQHYMEKYHPAITLQMQNVFNDLVIKNVVEHKTELGFCYYTTMETAQLDALRARYPTLTIRKLYSNQIVHCVRKDSSYLSQKNAALPIIPEEKSIVIYFSADYTTGEKLFAQQLEKTAFHYDSFLVSDDIALIRDLVLRYDAICAMPELTYRMFFNSREYTAIPFPDNISDDLYCVYDADCYEPHFDIVISAVEREIRHILQKRLEY